MEPVHWLTMFGVGSTGQIKLPNSMSVLFSANLFAAVKLDGCNVVGYTAWSLMDNFEWNQGYSQTFGLYLVDFSDPARPRTPKDSVSFFNKLIADNGWPQLQA